MCLLVSIGLMGCTAAEIQEESQFVPLSGSEAHPIKVAAGKAHTEKCGDWSDDSTYSPTNTHLKNHGCAVQQNIAAMLADPNDIAHPNHSTLGLGEHHAAAVRTAEMPVAIDTTKATKANVGSTP
jgi:type IV pilus biogenesis protein CpaD/CtpE